MKKHIPPIIALFLTFLAGTSLTGCGTAAPVQTGGLEILPSDPVLLEEPLETDSHQPGAPGGGGGGHRLWQAV